jgi:hypothetical protein
MSSYTLNAAVLHQIKYTAQPLIRMLSDEQRQAGMSVLQSMGVPF